MLTRLVRWVQTFFPFGVLVPAKPRHFREMLRVLWENRRELPYAWRILTHGVCDGCSLGPRGLRDDVIDGIHLCLTRLKLLRLNTMGPMPEARWTDIAGLRAMSNEALHHAGRVPYPLVYRKGEPGFRRISWDEALDKVADALRTTPADRAGFFASSRGLTNETYYTLQKLGRVAGTPHVDSCARLCHAASTSGLKHTIGWAAPTSSLSDLIGTELVVLFGTDLPNNQPVSMKYLHFAKKAGTKIVVINPFREPALERYWVPSVASSALFGTALLDDFFPVAPGGDIAFISGVLKELLARGLLDRAFIEARTEGFAELEAALGALEWATIEHHSGLKRADIARFAAMYGQAKSAVIVYSMGLTQHRFGVDNVKAIVNLALAKGNIGRPKTGVVPIRGHSGVQGTAECGMDADKLPGGVEVDEQAATALEHAWGVPIPHRRGLKAAHFLDRAGEGGVDFLYMAGGNYIDTMPEPDAARSALSKIRLRVHQDIVFNTSALVEPDASEGEILMLPAQTRYEQRGGGTSTSTERRIRFTPEIHGRRIGEAKAEWEIPVLIGQRLGPATEAAFNLPDSASVREEMGRVIPLYRGIERLGREGDHLQWGGERLGADGFPNMPNNRARFSNVPIPHIDIPPGHLFLTSRRGKQFNSITWGQKDGVTGAASRKAIFFAREDLQALGLKPGAAVRVKNQVGSMDGVCIEGPCRPGHIQAFWPEANAVTGRRYDPVSGEPDYNALVQVEPL